MPYLIFNSFNEADTRDVKGAEDEGNPDYKRLWGTVEDHSSDRVALNITENLNHLTSEERDALVEDLPEGWVRNPDIP